MTQSMSRHSTVDATQHSAVTFAEVVWKVARVVNVFMCCFKVIYCVLTIDL